MNYPESSFNIFGSLNYVLIFRGGSSVMNKQQNVWSFFSDWPIDTLPKTNIAPENGWLEY